MSPVPKRIDEYFQAAHELYAKVNPVLQEGDIIFRRGHLRLLGGLVNYSQLLSWWAESPFAHAGIVLQQVDDTFVVVDSGPYGIKRVFLIDWLIAGPENVVVKRIRPADRDKIPQLLAAVRDLVERDVLHDDKYITGDDRFYCTEIVDHCFREIGLPLAPKIAMRDMPNIHRWDLRGLFEIIAIVAGLDLSHEVAIAGNEEIGMYSSPVLVEVLNLLPDKYRHPPFALPRARPEPFNRP
ncbi:MAG: YiiX/YebB-like N1pC/P60 family cysteine hydrolase [Phycisphaerae bacterium]